MPCHPQLDINHCFSFMKNNQIVIGAVQFGMPYGVANTNAEKVSDKEIENILSYSKLMGVNSIDTAISYGESEKKLGEFGVDNWDVITKLPELPSNCPDVSSWVVEQVNNSLCRLKVSKVYGILLHRPMQLLEKEGVELWEALQSVKKRCFTDKVGFSISDPKELDDLYQIFRPDIVQAPYNIFDRRIETSGWLKRMNENKIEIHVRSVFLQGLLLLNKEKRPAKFNRWNRLWLYWEEWLDSNNITARQACISFVFSNKNIDKVVVGVNNIDQIQEVLSTEVEPLTIPDDFELLDYDLINPSNWDKL